MAEVSTQALQLAPDDDDLFTGWAESIVGLDMLGDATQAYTRLREENPEWAEVRMGVIKGWLVERRTDAGELDPADVERMAGWIAEQEGAAG